MFTFRFQLYDNFVYKEKLGTKLKDENIAKRALLKDLNRGGVTISSIKHIGDDKIEIIKRNPKSSGLLYKLGVSKKGVFERVIIDRKNKETAIDRFDANYYKTEPFLGKRDLFYEHDGTRFYVRHVFWTFLGFKPWNDLLFQMSQLSYKRMFR